MVAWMVARTAAWMAARTAFRRVFWRVVLRVEWKADQLDCLVDLTAALMVAWRGVG